MNGQYLVFCGEVYYSIGGAFDFHSRHHEQEKAIEVASKLIGQSLKTNNPSLDEDEQNSITIEWSHVFDIEKQQIVNSYGKAPMGSANKQISVAVEAIKTTIDRAGKVYIAGELVHKLVFTEGNLGWRLENREELIDNTIDFLIDSQKREYIQPMKEEIKLLASWSDEYVWVNLSVGCFCSPSLHTQQFNNLCTDALEKNKALCDEYRYSDEER